MFTSLSDAAAGLVRHSSIHLETSRSIEEDLAVILQVLTACSLLALLIVNTLNLRALTLDHGDLTRTRIDAMREPRTCARVAIAAMLLGAILALRLLEMAMTAFVSGGANPS